VLTSGAFAVVVGVVVERVEVFKISDVVSGFGLFPIGSWMLFEADSILSTSFLNAVKPSLEIGEVSGFCPVFIGVTPPSVVGGDSVFSIGDPDVFSIFFCAVALVAGSAFGSAAFCETNFSLFWLLGSGFIGCLEVSFVTVVVGVAGVADSVFCVDLDDVCRSFWLFGDNFVSVLVPSSFADIDRLAKGVFSLDGGVAAFKSLKSFKSFEDFVFESSLRLLGEDDAV